MLKFCVLKGKSVSILHPKKLKRTILSSIIFSMSNVSYEKDNLIPTTCLVNKKINSETLVSFNILYNNFIQCLFILLFGIIFYLYFLLIKYNHLPLNYLHCFVNCYLVITMTTINHHVIF